MAIGQQALEEGFTALADVTGKVMSPVTLKVYVDYLAERGVTEEQWAHGVRKLVIGWDRPYWPSPEMLVGKVREFWFAKLAAQKVGGGEQYADPSRVAQEQARIAAQAEAEAQAKLAREWASTHPDEAKAIARRVDAEFRQQYGATRPSQLSPALRAFRDATITAAIAKAARGHLIPPSPPEEGDASGGETSHAV